MPDTYIVVNERTGERVTSITLGGSTLDAGTPLDAASALQLIAAGYKAMSDAGTITRAGAIAMQKIEEAAFWAGQDS